MEIEKPGEQRNAEDKTRVDMDSVKVCDVVNQPKANMQLKA